MKKILLLLISVTSLLSCQQKIESPMNQGTENTEVVQKETDDKEVKAPFGIAIHGGAGTILKENMTDEKRTAYSQKLEEAIRTGHKILDVGGTSVEAIEATIHILEDSPLFNAGKGSVFTFDKTNEMDASIMNGADLSAGAITGVATVKNPISLARAVMENSPHVMLSGLGAEQFAQEQELEIVSPDYFFTQERMNTLLKVQAKAKEQASLQADKKDLTQTRFDLGTAELTDSKFGTVGCVALDRQGNLAAGTSTGGMTNKRWDRIGDTPIIGAGTYANNRTCAVSSTGWGEYFIRAMVAHDISALMEYKGLSLEEAAREVIHNKVGAMGGDGGVVAIDHNGNVAFEFNTPGMYRAAMNAAGEVTIGMYEKDSTFVRK